MEKAFPFKIGNEVTEVPLKPVEFSHRGRAIPLHQLENELAAIMTHVRNVTMIKKKYIFTWNQEMAHRSPHIFDHRIGGRPLLASNEAHLKCSPGD